MSELRAALEALPRWPVFNEHDGSPIQYGTLVELPAVLELVDAAPAINVEWLATAMNEAWQPDDVFIDDSEYMWEPFAAKVAAEYALVQAEELAAKATKP